MDDTLLVSVQQAGESETKVMCVGELDVATAGSLGRALEQAIAWDPASLHVDCTGLSFISIDGMHLLLDTAVRCRARGMSVEIDLNPNGWRLMEVLGHSHAEGDAERPSSSLTR